MSANHPTHDPLAANEGNDKDDQATPLDILLNAITGTSNQYPYTEQDDLTGESVVNEELNLQGFLQAQPPHAETSRKRPHEDDGGSPRRTKIAKIISAHINLSRPTTDEGALDKPAELFTTIEVWHPRAAQKSYVSEKRMINPPPTLRVFGPLSHLLTGVTLSSKTTSKHSGQSSVTLSAQTHHIPLGAPSDTPEGVFLSSKAKRNAARLRLRLEAAKAGFGGALPWERAKLVAKERQVLSDGLAFPGLWVSSEIGKAKDFQLELKVARPGDDISMLKPKPAPDTPAVGHSATTVGSSDIDVSQSQAEYEHSSSFPPDLTAADLEQIGRGHSSSDFDLDPSLANIGADGSATGVSAPPIAGPSTWNAGSEPNLSQRSKRSQILPVDIESPWGTFLSGPLSIISKPSQRTAKARSMVTCLTETDSFALYVRINSQTVRTKYMKLENDADDGSPHLAFRTGKWSPFRFEVIKRATPPYNPEDDAKQPNRYRVFEDEKNAKVLTYGSIITVVDVQSGVRSEPVKLVKVDKNEVVVGADEGGPVSELQRVGFVKYDANVADQGLRSRWYLSAPGARAGGAELFEPDERYVRVKAPSSTPQRQNSVQQSPADPGPSTLGEVSTPVEDRLFDHTILDLPQETSAAVSDELSYANANHEDSIAMDTEVDSGSLKRKRKTPRRALAKATLREDEDITGSTLVWQQANRGMKEVAIEQNKKVPGPSRTTLADVERVEDWMCWTIMSVDCFSYTFFDTSNGSDHIPTRPLDPIPRLLSEAKYHQPSNTLDLLLSNILTETPYDVYLGSMGPLPVSLWRSANPGDPTKPVGESAAIRVDGGSGSFINGRRVTTLWANYIPHTLFVVELPSKETILRLLTGLGAGDMTAPALAPDTSALEQQTPNGLDDQIERPQIGQPRDDRTTSPSGDIDDSPWLAEDEVIGIDIPTGDMTIQEALRNAEDAFNDAIDLTAFEGMDASFQADMSGQSNTEPGQGSRGNRGENSGDGPEGAQGLRNDAMEDTRVVLTRASGEGAIEPELSLPLLLLRKEDGVGFGTGTSLVFPRTSGAEWYPQIKRQ